MGNPVHQFSTKGARRVWPVSRGCLLLRGTWSCLRICWGPFCPTLDFVFTVWIMIAFYALLTSLFCIQYWVLNTPKCYYTTVFIKLQDILCVKQILINYVLSVTYGESLYMHCACCSILFVYHYGWKIVTTYQSIIEGDSDIFSTIFEKKPFFSSSVSAQVSFSYHHCPSPVWRLSVC
jgi:amino acid permease